MVYYYHHRDPLSGYSASRHRSQIYLGAILCTGKPEWPHRQCVGLAYPMMRVHAMVAAASLAICCPHIHHAIRGVQGVLPCVGWG